MPQPVIGVTTYREIQKRGRARLALNEVYLSSLIQAGAIPLMVPLGLSGQDLPRLLDVLNGVLFSGGGDISPEQYGGKPHPTLNDVDPERDRLEIQLFANVVERKLPFLGICRGLQLINVALGGTLYEDLADQRLASLPHQAPARWPRNRILHPIWVEEKSRLFKLLQKQETGVNSHHHQGVRKPGKGLEITAVAPDSVIEALELRGYPFGLAVQWHPEWMPEDPDMQALFSAFVQAASNTQSG